MDQITDQVQPVGHPVSLTCASCIGAGQRAAAGKAARARAGMMTHRVSGPASSRDPAGARAGPAFRALFTGAAVGLLAAHLQGFSGTRPWPC